MRPIFLHAHSRPLTCVQFNRDGDIVFTAGKDAQLVAWYTKSGARIGTYACGKGVVWNFDCTYDTKNLIASSADQKVKVFDVCEGIQLHEIEEGGPCKFVEWNRMPGRQTRYALAHDSFGSQSRMKIKVVSLETGEPEDLWSQDDYSSRCTRVHWGPFDRTILSCHEDGTIWEWDASTGKYIREVVAHSKAITCASFSADRTLMLTSCSDGSAKLWDTAKLECLKVYETDRPLNACGISPLYNVEGPEGRMHVLLGGGQAASEVTTTGASEGKFEALLYHMVHSELLGSIKGHFGPINSIAWMPQGTGFISGGEEGYARIYHFDDEYFTEKFQ